VLLFFLIAGLYYAFYWPGAARKQKTVEHMANVLDIPGFRYQVTFRSKFKPSVGFVEKTIVSTESPQAFCRLLTMNASTNGWQVVQECHAPTPSDQTWTLFCKSGVAGNIYYQGTVAEGFSYMISLGWGSVNVEPCER
jgi:hypothetical protein